MDQSIIDLFDEYTHAPLPRRVFIARLAKLTGGTAAAMALLPVLENNYAQAAMVPPDDPDLSIRQVSFDGATGAVKGYLARPKGDGKLPGIVVIHENRGLNPHIEDIARRLASAGFLALAVDFLSPMGGTPDDQDKAREMIGQLDGQKTIANGVAAVAYLAGHAESTGKTGVIGFCWGGALANQMAVHVPEAAAVVVYYGMQPKAADVPKIKAKLLIHYAGLDKRIGAGAEAYEKELSAAGVQHMTFVYDGVNHAFNNDTNAARYNAEAAKLSWGRTVAFFKETLG